MWTSSIHRARVGPNLWDIVSFVLIPLAWAGESTTVTTDSCGTYIKLVTGSHAIHWQGDVLRTDCTVYIQNEPTYENTLCAEAMKYDVKDKRFILTFLSGTSYNEDTKMKDYYLGSGYHR
ncbi:hypothetical protein KP79_PYT03306 [Mizuhopecten yessoensis]|uniref:CUB domain-containing protein n=1 Tax=Mizuhopecten yessoensis TaxID=6573 RepID=A0A210PGU3_MIZYE|nr:hypothetical protein KP79_PYT03306 [Mizuhopecten yessoensis]